MSARWKCSAAVQRSELAANAPCANRRRSRRRSCSRLEVEKSRITVDRALDEERIKREQEIQRLEVERRKALELASRTGPRHRSGLQGAV